MHTRLRSQPAVSIVPDDSNGSALYTGDLTRRYFDDFGRKTIRLAPLQIHSQQHLSPVLGLRPARPGLNVEECIRAVGLVTEHPTKFETLDIRLNVIDIGANPFDGRLVTLGFGHLQKFRGFRENGVYASSGSLKRDEGDEGNQPGQGGSIQKDRGADEGNERELPPVDERRGQGAEARS